MSRRLTAALAVTVSLALTSAAVSAQGAPAAAPPTAGAAGIGDPYYPTYGNGGYDVSSYDLAIKYRPSSDKLQGKATIRARATQALSSFHLDLLLKPSKVTVNGTKASIRHSGQELVVTPARPLAAGASMTVVVAYAGVPHKVKVKTLAIQPYFWSKSKGAVAVGEPEIAAWWFPSNDHPRDKATFRVRLTVPRGTEAVSNGALARKHKTKHWTTWDWRESQPMATYLAFFAAGQYTISTKTVAGRPFTMAVPAKKAAVDKAATADLKLTPRVIAWEAAQFGAYPFSQTGAVLAPFNLGFALENQTRPVFDRAFWAGGRDLSVVVHENAHQWFGDSVSVRNWRDIWLNEGFATYAEWLWDEQHGGDSTDTWLSLVYFEADPEFWQLPIGGPGAGEEFRGEVYFRGAATLAALRNRIGDAPFRTLLRTWAAQHRYGNGDTAAFAALAERISGQQLDTFFRVWLSTSARPANTKANGLGVTRPAGSRQQATELVRTLRR